MIPVGRGLIDPHDESVAVDDRAKGPMCEASAVTDHHAPLQSSVHHRADCVFDITLHGAACTGTSDLAVVAAVAAITAALKCGRAVSRRAVRPRTRIYRCCIGGSGG
eukprot:CAMPEP_0181366670 /NCGR_PEP_ID=MMETSP1106-20121128/10845_1 /TAXON_ID=81844 /ORGANISM="Mantoniella antarctica, Strain SL-175" /LENGTH=106 /DNA_ID=CAMNT_0023482069 /DNA_START=1095 /DNA_END=1411 /DNA_ORIENTATION=-